MNYLYFDESIRERGNFIIGALVYSEHDLSTVVSDEWLRLGLNPDSDEYKSSDPKEKSAVSLAQRKFVGNLLQQSKLGLTVAPTSDRSHLGKYCTDLLVQLNDAGILEKHEHVLYIDQNIALDKKDVERLNKLNVVAYANSDSKKVGGIQVADHAAHALGGMLLEEMGIITKLVRAGENSGYHPDDLLELGFELWASLRYSLIGRNEYIAGLSPPHDDPANPYFRIEGIGLYIAPTCCESLAQHARNRFGTNYLGCIH